MFLFRWHSRSLLLDHVFTKALQQLSLPYLRRTQLGVLTSIQRFIGQPLISVSKGRLHGQFHGFNLPDRGIQTMRLHMLADRGAIKPCPV